MSGTRVNPRYVLFHGQKERVQCDYLPAFECSNDERVRLATENILEEMNASNCILIHCMEYSQPSNIELPRPNDKRGCKGYRYYSPYNFKFKGREKPGLETDERETCARNGNERLSKDLETLSSAARVIVTWRGRQNQTVLHEVLGPLVRKSRQGNGQLDVITFPRWEDISRSAVDATGKKMEMVQLREEEGISSACTRMLLPDVPAPRAANGVDVSAYDDFEQRLICSLEKYADDRDIPIACVLINGDENLLATALFAMERPRRIPVIFLQNSGGFADVVSDMYDHANEENYKEWDDDGKVRERVMRCVESAEDIGISEDGRTGNLLSRISELLRYVCVYRFSKDLPGVIFEGLLKYGKQKRIRNLFKMIDLSQFSNEGPQVQLNFFTEAVRQNEVDTVRVFLKEFHVDLKKPFDFYRLYILNYKGCVCSQPGTQESDATQTKGTCATLRSTNFRKRLLHLLGNLDVFPLCCQWEDCDKCNENLKQKLDQENLQLNPDCKKSITEMLRDKFSCMPASQELFLWSIFEMRTDLAVVFWEHCDDKIVAALLAQAIFENMASQKDCGKGKLLKESAKRFEGLAVETLSNCREMDKVLTESLLTKPCPPWGDVSALVLAVMSGNMVFISQPACEKLLTRILWGQPSRKKNQNGQTEEEARPCRFVHTDNDGQCCVVTKLWCLSPVLNYCIFLVLHAGFLCLFSYVLLSESYRTLTPSFGALIAWVCSIMLNEITQLLCGESLTRDIKKSKQTHTKCCCIAETTHQPLLSAKNNKKQTQQHPAFSQQARNYLRQKWNVLDVFAILMFWLGLLVLVPVECVYWTGRIILSIDIFLFFMRTLQMMMIYKSLGVMLVMVFRMIEDTLNFMLILLMFVLAYAMASETLLYPEGDVTWQRIILLPRKAYWQVFGELLLDEIEFNSDENSTEHAGSLHGQPGVLSVGRFTVTVLLAFYVIITNVLLLNLLIAQFNQTFGDVLSSSMAYQAWNRCKIIREFYQPRSAPPPLNLVIEVISLLVCRRCCKVCFGCGKSRADLSREKAEKILRKFENKQAHQALKMERRRDKQQSPHGKIKKLHGKVAAVESRQKHFHRTLMRLQAHLESTPKAST